jgi:cytochrome bd-type quinol oxidase subunit 1
MSTIAFHILFHAHSGVRYLVLLAALAALVILFAGWSGRKPWTKGARIATAAFTGLLDLQVLLGVLLVTTGVFYPRLIGHITLMLLAAIFAHGLSVAARRAADDRRRYGLALAGVLLALVLIVAGIAAIGRTPWGTTGRPTVQPASSGPQG